jgi:endo-1,4-beta-xylanase
MQQNLITTEQLTSFEATAKVTKATVPVTGAGLPFNQALRVTTPDVPSNFWDYQITCVSLEGVSKGDVCLATFWVRCIGGGQPETGEGKIGFCFERNGAPYTSSIDRPLTAPRNWQKMEIPFIIVEDLTASNAHMTIRLGFMKQTIEIGGLTIVNYKKTRTLESLPKTKITYAGREANAPWRKEAEARIEKLRKGDLAIRVVDKAGKPVVGAKVTVRMKRHAFNFGTAVTANILFNNTPDSKKYREMIAEHFTMGTVENHLKWSVWEGTDAEWGGALGRKTVEWLREQKLAVRGHVLVWPSWRNTPQDVETLKDNPAALRKRIVNHITDEATQMRGKLADWDVVNEPFDNHDVTDILGRTSLVDWFKQAKKIDPKPVLYLNDYPPLDGTAKENRHLNSFYDNIAYLKQQGAPIEGIGFQGHFGETAIPPVNILSGLDRFAKFGLPIAITEFDINSKDEQFQADYMRDAMIALFSHASVERIILWGFWEGAHWFADAALWRKNWEIKPSGQAWLDLVKKAWWTNADGKTTSKGDFVTRGFLGEYEITVEHSGSVAKINTSLPTKGAVLRVVMK